MGDGEDLDLTDPAVLEGLDVQELAEKMREIARKADAGEQHRYPDHEPGE